MTSSGIGRPSGGTTPAATTISSDRSPIARVTADRLARRSRTDATARARRFVPARRSAAPAATARTQTSIAKLSWLEPDRLPGMSCVTSGVVDDEESQAQPDGDERGTRERPPDQPTEMTIRGGVGDRLHGASLGADDAAPPSPFRVIVLRRSAHSPVRTPPDRPHLVVAGRTGTRRGPASRLAPPRTPVPLLVHPAPDILDLAPGLCLGREAELARRGTSE